MYRLFKRPYLTASCGASIALSFYYYHANVRSSLSRSSIPYTSNTSVSSQTTPAANCPMGDYATTLSSPPTSAPPANGKTTTHLSRPYTATFSVPLHCDDCTSSLSTALVTLDDHTIHSLSFSIPDNIITVTGTAPPSAIITKIQETGRTAILRGSGARNDGAAVCILETPPPLPRNSESSKSTVCGLARLIELSDTLTMLDLALTNLPPGTTWKTTLRSKGDISHGVHSMGPIFRGFDDAKDGELGILHIGKDGRAGLVSELSAGWRVWEMVGRGIVVERVKASKSGEGGEEEEEEEAAGKRIRKNEEEADQEDAVMGVVARSAGVWENENKIVCTCSGKTVWQEREEMMGKGMA